MKLLPWCVVGIALMAFVLVTACKNPSSGGGEPSYTYTVIFDKNHADSTGWTNANPATKKVVSPETTVGALPTSPTRNDWNFIGWNMQADGNGPEFTAETEVTDDITVYAQWKSTIEGSIPYSVELTISGHKAGDDSVAISPSSGSAGDTITITYTLAGTKVNNRLAFSGVTIDSIDQPGSGTIDYTISDTDARNGTIAINAIFTHSDLEIDTIAFADNQNVSKEYGDSPFTRALTNTGAGSGAVTYSSSNTNVATVNNTTGTVSIKTAGETIITAVKASDGTYEEANDVYTLFVAPRQLTISTPTVTTTKQYDGNATAHVVIGTLNNVVSGDTVTVTGSASYDAAAAGTHMITVTYTIAGASAHNYHKPVDYTITGTITSADPLPVPRTTVIDFETEYTIGYTNGDNTPTVEVIADPAASGQKSLQITTTGNNFNQAATIRFNLPYEVKNYGTLSFRLRAINGDGQKTVSVYLAQNTSAFVQYGFGNPANGDHQFVANWLGENSSVSFATKNTWTDYSFTITDPGAVIRDLKGSMYMAIGIHGENTIRYMLDDITFTMKDSFDPPPIPPPPSPPTPLAQGAVATGEYRNLFKEMNKTDAEIAAKVNATWARLFNGTDDQKIYYEVEGDKAYIYDSGNNDVRSEGMSYGMMIAVQLDKKAEFDKLWNWAYTYMYHNPATSNDKDKKGFFAWQCGTSGNKMDQNPAADGEYYFVTALLFAENRWGNGAGTYEYGKHARDILYNMLNRPVIDGQTGNPMFNSTHKMPVFSVMEAGYTDPSYHLPAFYDVWALEVEAKPEYWNIFGGEAGAKANAQFWKDAANASRTFFPTTTNATTGLGPDYAEYNGAARTSSGDHQYFMFDAWRIAMNIGMDYHWWAKDDWQKTFADRIQSFFASKGVETYGNQLQLNGEPVSNKTQNHSPGLVACNAVASLAATNEVAWEFLEDFWNITMTSGQYRYYDGGLYMLGLLNVTGNFKAYLSSNTVVDPGVPNSTISPTSATFDKRSDLQAPVAVTMTLNGNTLESVENGATTLVRGTQYTDNSTSVTFPVSYLSTLANGSYTLTFTFSQGTDRSLSLTVKTSPDTPPPGSTTLEYNFATASNPGVTFAPSGGGTASVTGGALSVNISSSNTVTIIPFDTGGDALSTFSSVYLEIRPVSGDMKFKPINIQIPGSSGTFTAGDGSNTTIGSATGNNPLGDLNEWKTHTISLNTTSSASGTVHLAIDLPYATGVYEIRVIRLQ